MDTFQSFSRGSAGVWHAPLMKIGYISGETSNTTIVFAGFLAGNVYLCYLQCVVLRLQRVRVMVGFGGVQVVLGGGRPGNGITRNLTSGYG
jgi:hypothetical protein